MYEALFKNALFPLYETAQRRATPTYAAEYTRSQWLPPEQLEALQLKKLNRLLAHCWEHVPFLQQHWRASGCEPGELRSVAELSNYPTLTKQQITDNYEGMIALPWRGRTISKRTSGSTGTPFSFEYTLDVYARRMAIMWRGYGWAGAGLGVRTAYLWGTGLRTEGWGAIKDRLYHGAFNRRFFNALTLSSSTIDQTIEDMVAYRPKAVVGYGSPLVTLARRMLETGRKISTVRTVLVGAEGVSSRERSDIEQAFGCRMFNTYGSREVMLMAAECEQHDGLHVNADHLVLETIGQDGRGVAAGVSGEVAVTDLGNFGMPMVRYLNGDRATYRAGGCACGRALPLLASIDGRVLDTIQTPDGRYVPGTFLSIVMNDWPDVRQYQMVQTARDRLELRLVVPAPWTPEQRSRLIERLLQTTGPSVTVEIVEVDVIALSPSGKRKLTVALQNVESVA